MTTLSSKLSAKAVALDSMTIDNPSGRTSKKTGEVLKATVYFDKGKVDKKTGKVMPTDKSKLYTPVADAAPLIEGCVCEKVITLTLWESDTDRKTYRFLDSALDDSDREEITLLKGVNNTEDGLTDFDKLMAKLTNSYMMSLPEDKRNDVADYIARKALAACDKLRKAPTAKKATARIRLWK